MLHNLKITHPKWSTVNVTVEFTHFFQRCRRLVQTSWTNGVYQILNSRTFVSKSDTISTTPQRLFYIGRLIQNQILPDNLKSICRKTPILMPVKRQQKAVCLQKPILPDNHQHRNCFTLKASTMFCDARNICSLGLPIIRSTKFLS